jgi:PAS domain S-box-containing protein
MSTMDSVGIPLNVNVAHGKKPKARRLNWEAFPDKNPNPVFQIGKDQSFVYANQTGLKCLAKWKLGLGKPAPEDWLPTINVVLTGGSMQEIEKACGHFVYSFLFVPIDRKGYVNVYGHDITQRRKVGRTLLRANLEWKRTFDSVPDLIAVIDSQHRIVRANRAMTNRLRVKPNQCVGLSCHMCVHGTSIPPEFCPHSQTMKDGKEHTSEVHEDRLGGDFIVTTTPLKDKRGRIIGSVHVARDITLRKKRERALQQQAALIELSPDGIIVRKPDGTITFWSQGAEKLYGWKRGEAVGQNIKSLLKTALNEQFDNVEIQFTRSKRWSGELVHSTKNGKKVIVQSFWLPKFDENGEILEIFESNVDITDRKQMQKELQEYAVRLEELVQERTMRLKEAQRLATIGETAGMVGHDIRNPLQAIMGDVYLAKSDLSSMQESEEKESVGESLDAIAKNLEYINKIVADLQDYAKPMSPAKEEVELGQCVDDTLSTLEIAGNIEVSVCIEPDFPKMNSDPAYLKRILTNLALNATQAMPNGGKLRVCAKAEDGKALISVEDSGEGMTKEVRDRVFKPLFTTKAKGQGFGLAVVKKLTEGLDGKVTLESQVGKGTKFLLEFPLRKN